MKNKFQFYKFNENKMQFQSIRLNLFFLFFAFTCLGLSIGIGICKLNSEKAVALEQEELVILLKDKEKENFKPEQAYELLLQLRAPFPEIIYAQAILESNFNSPLFKSNNNCFGMKEPGKRLTMSIGEKNGYADFLSWKDCIIDRCFYNALYLSDIKTEDQYYQYLLNSNYAADMPNYVIKIKELVKQVKKEKK